MQPVTNPLFAYIDILSHSYNFSVVAYFKAAEPKVTWALSQ